MSQLIRGIRAGFATMNMYAEVSIVVCGMWCGSGSSGFEFWVTVGILFLR